MEIFYIFKEELRRLKEVPEPLLCRYRAEFTKGVEWHIYVGICTKLNNKVGKCISLYRQLLLLLSIYFFLNVVDKVIETLLNSTAQTASSRMIMQINQHLCKTTKQKRNIITFM